MTLSCNVYAYLGGVWTDITSDVLANPGISSTVGIRSNKETDRIASPGSLSFELKNFTGKYTPGSGTAHADWKKGVAVKVAFTGVSTKTKFIGRVDAIDLKYAYNNNRASVVALDWMHSASKLPLNLPALQTSKRADEIITSIVALSPVAPTATSLQTGSTTFPYAFHDNTTKTTAYTEITKAVLSEWGYCYVKQDGTLTFEAYNGRASTQKTVTVASTPSYVLLETGDRILLEDGSLMLLDDTVATNADATTIQDIDIVYGEHIINRVDTQAYPYKPGRDDVLVYKQEDNQFLPAGTTTSFRIQFTDPSSRLPIASSSVAVKQYTLIHFEDNSSIGISGILDDADLNVLRQAADTFYYPTTPFSSVGGTTTTGKFSSGYSGNGTSDYIYSISQEKFNFGAGDFTVDWWENRGSATAGRATLSRNTTGAFSPFVFGYSDGATARVYMTSDGATWDIANAKSLGTISTGTWVHYAITRSGNTFRTFKNGVQQDTWTSSATILTSTSNFSILLYNGVYAQCVIDELRMIKGYAAWTAAFTPPSKKYTMSGLNWSAHTGKIKTGTEITNNVTLTATAGGAGIDVTVTNSSGSDGYLTLEIYAPPLESLSPIAYVKEDATSVSAYGYFSERIDMRLRDNIAFAKTIADTIVTNSKDPASVLNKVSMSANKTSLNEALFMDCDIGDLVRVNDSLSGYNNLGYIQGISWKAIPSGSTSTLIDFTWIFKKQ